MAIDLAIRRADEQQPSPENRAALGVLNLVEGRLTQAVSLLRAAHKRKPDDPRVLNDLAAALLTVSQTTRDPWPAFEAIEMAEQSALLQPSPPALFNKALALEQCGLQAQAIAAWHRYRELDEKSTWSDEAAQRLERLESSRPVKAQSADLALVAENPSAARQLGETSLLTDWAKGTLEDERGKAKAEAALARAESLARSLHVGGRLLAASIATIREAEQEGDQNRIAQLAQGHQAFGQAFSWLREEQTEKAQSEVESAVAALRSANSPFELRARVLRAWAATKPDWTELKNLGLAAEKEQFPTIAAEVRRITAFWISQEGQLEAAVDVYRDAQKQFEGLDEWENSAVSAAMTSELLGLLGREEEATSELTTALAAAPRVNDPWNRYSIYVAATTAAAGLFSRAAVELRLEAADACRDMPVRPLCPVDSWLRIAALTPDAAAAKDALRQAEDLLPAAPESPGKARTKLDLAVARARWLSSDDSSTEEWEEAADLLPGVEATYEAKGRSVLAARARVMRARVLQRLGLPEEASAEYKAGLQVFRRWDRIDHVRPERAERYSPRELRSVYEELIKVELDMAGDRPSPEAFLFSEEMRDRLAPRQSGAPRLPKSSGVGGLVSTLPADVAIVEYAILGNRAVAWILADKRLDQVVLPLQDELGQRIRSLSKERRLDSWKLNSGALFKELLAPVLERLPKGTKRLVLVPDSDLYGLPFRALWNPDKGRYLDETLLLSFAPSVRQALDVENNQRIAPAEASVLSLGFTSFFPQLGLKPLPRAAGEAEAVREVYGGLVPAGCEEVKDWASFSRCAPQAGVLHLATHAAANSVRSEWSGLAFEQETVNLNRLWSELPDLKKRPLVVLSACQSVAAGSGEGLGGLARPFLASGARAVVGTLWEIHDEDAADFFIAFHRAYRRSNDPAEALSEARKNLERWEERPWVWGAVEVINAGIH